MDKLHEITTALDIVKETPTVAEMEIDVYENVLFVHVWLVNGHNIRIPATVNTDPRTLVNMVAQMVMMIANPGSLV